MQHGSTRTVNRYLTKNKFKYLQIPTLQCLIQEEETSICKKSNKAFARKFLARRYSILLPRSKLCAKDKSLQWCFGHQDHDLSRSNEGLLCTTRGKKEGNGGNLAYMSYDVETEMMYLRWKSCFLVRLVKKTLMQGGGGGRLSNGFL